MAEIVFYIPSLRTSLQPFQTCLTEKIVYCQSWVLPPRATKPGKPLDTVGMGITQRVVGQLLTFVHVSMQLSGEPYNIWPWQPVSTGGYLLWLFCVIELGHDETTRLSRGGVGAISFFIPDLSRRDKIIFSWWGGGNFFSFEICHDETK